MPNLAKKPMRTIKEASKLHEAQKRLKYEQRIVEFENSSFNPLVFATTGGAAPTVSKVMTRLAFKLSEKKTLMQRQRSAKKQSKLCPAQKLRSVPLRVPFTQTTT